MSCGVPKPSMDICCYLVSIHPAQTPSGSIWESLGFDSRGRRFTSPLHPLGRLNSYSTERPQNKRKTTHRDHHRNHSKRNCFLEGGSPQRHLVRLAGLRTVSACYHLNDRPKSALSEVSRVDTLCVEGLCLS